MAQSREPKSPKRTKNLKSKLVDHIHLTHNKEEQNSKIETEKDTMNDKGKEATKNKGTKRKTKTKKGTANKEEVKRGTGVEAKIEKS